MEEQLASYSFPIEFDRDVTVSEPSKNLDEVAWSVPQAEF